MRCHARNRKTVAGLFSIFREGDHIFSGGKLYSNDQKGLLFLPLFIICDSSNHRLIGKGGKLDAHSATEFHTQNESCPMICCHCNFHVSERKLSIKSNKKENRNCLYSFFNKKYTDFNEFSIFREPEFLISCLLEKLFFSDKNQDHC